MTTQLVPDATKFIPGRLDVPPPLDLDLVDAGRTTGWIADNAIGFRGFRDETEAAHAALVAQRSLARRLARTHGARTVPVGIEPLAPSAATNAAPKSAAPNSMRARDRRPVSTVEKCAKIVPLSRLPRESVRGCVTAIVKPS